ncbi:MAG: TonB-dependent receptor family protein [Prevotellaceae bacterium]|jgi:outer membrane receptor protein involved in Fe transport|nr:TonB-dependent receptor family protein [Prevotellaceae bacterium]
MKCFSFLTGIFFIFGFILFFPKQMFADSGVIQGTVADAKNKQSLEYVTVTVKKQNSETILRGTLTDKNGNFIFNNLDYGEYTVDISFVGYKSSKTSISLTENTGKFDMKQVFIAEEAETLQGITIEGMKSQMKIDIDKKVFNVDQNIASSGGNASDVLSNIPSVEVDTEGTVSLRGNSAVTIWINGRASGLSADNRSQILEQLPAENIDKIEVITNPSAKYSPEGTAGIINIVLKENRKAGYFGSVQAGADTRGGYNASFNLNYSSSKIESNISLGYRKRSFLGGGYSNRQNIGVDTTFLNQNSNSEGAFANLFARLGLTWHVSSKDHLSFGGFGMFGNRDSENTITYRSNDPRSFTASNRLSSSTSDMLGANFELNYKHEFNKTSNLDFTASYNKWKMDENSEYSQKSLFADSHETLGYQRQKGMIDPHNWELQLDYTNAFSENSKIEAGYKGTFGREKSPVETFAGTNRQDEAAVTSLFNKFIYNQDIHALYTTYSGRINSFGYQAGLRGEYSSINTVSLGYGQTEQNTPYFKNDYFSLFPSLFLSYSLPKDNEIQLNYTRRISRPRGRQLNSFKNITDSSNISFGNPLLKPEYSNAFEFNYIKNWNSHIFSMSIYHRTTDNVIQNINYLDNNVMLNTFENIAQTTSSGTELVLKNRLFRKLDLTTTVNLFYYKLDKFSYLPENSTVPVTGRGQEDFSWNAKIIANLILPYSFSLQLTGDYNARQVIAQGYRNPSYSLDAGIRKVFNQSFSASISVRDIFDSRRRHSYTSGTGFIQDSENWRMGRVASFTLTYSFGNMKAKRTEKKRTENERNSGYEESEF